jgi:prepilin-type processing-associated H-X9-DG protein
MDVIQPYIKSTQVFDCPSDAFQSSWGSGNTGRFKMHTQRIATEGAPDEYGSYQYNGVYQYMDSASCMSPMHIRKLAGIEDTSGTILTTEGDRSNFNSMLFHGWRDRTPRNGDITPGPNGFRLQFHDGELTARHLDMTNLLYVDGHVKAQKLTALKRPAAAGTPCVGAFAPFTSNLD